MSTRPVGAAAGSQEVVTAKKQETTSHPRRDLPPDLDLIEIVGRTAQDDAHKPLAEAGSPPEIEDDGFTDMKVWPCGCDADIDPHYEDFTEFQRQVRAGLKDLASQDVRYDNIEVLMVYWKDSDVTDVKGNAQALAEVLRSAPYNLVVTEHELNNADCDEDEFNDSFQSALDSVKGRVHSRDKKTSNLFVLYYGGHGATENADRLWKPKKASRTKLVWSDFQYSIYRFDCDIVFLFDCCFSKAMIEAPTTNSKYRRRCEIFCSSGLKEQSGAQTKSSFTAALKKYLQGRRAVGGLTFESLCNTMLNTEIRNTLIAEPRWHRLLNSNAAFRGKITLAKKNTKIPVLEPQAADSDSGYVSQIEERSRLSDTRILIKIRLTKPAEALSPEDWLKWFEARPHNVAHIDLAIVKKIEWVGVFESDSCLALLTVPVWLWHYMEENPACESLGVVRSPNLLKKSAKEATPFIQTVAKATQTERSSVDFERETFQHAKSDVTMLVDKNLKMEDAGALSRKGGQRPGKALHQEKVSSVSRSSKIRMGSVHAKLSHKLPGPIADRLVHSRVCVVK